MKLSTLLASVPVVRVDGPTDRLVSHVTRDSRDVRPGAVFVAIAGAAFDGHSAVSGLDHASAVVVSRPVTVPDGVTVVHVDNGRAAFAALCAAWHGYPGRDIRVIGVTGTNGKTTTTTLVDEALRAIGRSSGRIGTTGVVLNGAPYPSALTTPGAEDLQAILGQARDKGIASVAMEVSSIGLDQHRVDGVPYHTAVFTNLSRDHLDYHGTMEAYAASKARLFEQLLRAVGGWPRALLFEGDPSRDAMNAPPDHWTYGTDRANLRLESVEATGHGMTLQVGTPVGTVRIDSALVGGHNAQNLVAALGCLLTLDVPADEAAHGLAQVSGVAGRFETVANPGGALLLVDYAHTPDALRAALQAVRAVVPGRVLCVFGCGGDRDRGKRPQMGQVADEGADVVIVTSDNPRTEAPQQIVDDILQGVSNPGFVHVDREQAIAWAVSEARAGDAVLVAGKGHETYQDIGGERIDFDDRAALRRAVETA